MVNAKQISSSYTHEFSSTGFHWYGATGLAGHANGVYGWGITNINGICPVFKIPNNWDGADIKLRLRWASDSSPVIAEGETVIFDYSYRCLDWGTDHTDNGTRAIVTSSTYTGGAGENGRAAHQEDLTLPYDDGDQPLFAGGIITGGLIWNEAATYPEYTIVCPSFVVGLTTETKNIYLGG